MYCVVVPVCCVVLAVLVFCFWKLRGKLVRLFLRYKKMNSMISDAMGGGSAAGFIAGGDNTTGSASGGMLQTKLLANIVKQVCGTERQRVD